MKRILCLVLALTLCLTAAPALAAEKATPLMQKLALQYVKGSGLRGLVTLNVTGDRPWAQLLSALNDTPLQLRFIDGIGEGFQYKLYLTDADGAETGVSEIFSDGSGTAWIRSDFLLDTLVSFPTETDLLSSLTGLGVDNPTWYLAALRLLLMTGESWTESWNPQLADASLALDSWMNSFAGTPAILDQEDGKVMLFRSEIPAEEIKRQLKALIPMLLGNEELMILAGRQVTRAQEELYLNAGYAWYYDQCIDALPLTGSIVLERQATVLGEPVSMLMSFPIAGMGTLKEISISQEESTAALTLIWAEKTLSVTAITSEGTGITSGEVRYLKDEGDSFTAAYTLRSTSETGTDDSGRDTETYTWTLTLDPLPEETGEGYVAFSPIQLKAQALLYSKPGDFNPTTLELSSAAVIDGCDVSLAVKLRTTSLWELPAAPTAAATRSLSDMTPDERTALAQDWLANALLAIAAAKPQPTAEPTAEPTVEPTEPTAEPAAEPAVEATAEPLTEPDAAPSSAPEATLEPAAEPEAAPTDLPGVSVMTEPPAPTEVST